MNLGRKGYLVSFLFLSTLLYCQRGDFFVDNYTPREYQRGANNFGVTQTPDGLIFVANHNGILIYDGINWTSCERADEITIFSIERTVHGEVVAGAADGDIAVIAKNKKGKFQYRSISHLLPENERPQDAIRQIIVIDSLTYFLSSDKLIRYNGHSLQAFSPANSFHSRAFVLGKHLYLTDLGAGIKLLKGGKLVPVSGTDPYGDEKQFGSYPINDTTTVLVFRNIGFHSVYYDSRQPEKLRLVKTLGPSDQELIAAEVNNGCLLNNGNFMLTTNKNGAVEITPKLNIVHQYNSRTGISDDNVKAAYQDMNGNLWLSLYYGLSFIEKNSRLRCYTRNNGISGLVQDAVLFENKLFIASDKGVQYYDSLSEKFVSLNGFNKQTWNLLNIGDKLFICTARGLFMYRNKHISQINSLNTECIYHDKQDQALLYTGTDESIEIYRLTHTDVQLQRSHPIPSSVKSIAGDGHSTIYFATADRGIYYLKKHSHIELDSVKGEDGLPFEDHENFVFSFRGEILLGTDSGIYRLRKNISGKVTCIKDPVFWRLTKASQVFRASQANEDLICTQKYLNQQKFSQEQKTVLYQKLGNFYRRNDQILHRLNGVTVNMITLDTTEKLVFLCANEGLFILENQEADNRKQYHLVIKELIAKTDTLLENFSANHNSEVLRLPYSHNELRLMLGFTSFENQNVVFSYMLEGRDKNYSKWSTNPHLSFDNLFEGPYTLRLKARTEISDEDYEIQISFSIDPPWYRTIAAYALYLLLLILLIALIVRLNSKRLIRINKKLEQTIDERTRTISIQKSELEDKQKEILDSINYAQRIQRSMLASDALLSKHLKEYFVFFQPKDIVSGDFYWAAKLSDGGFALLTADSTGHGVPGAIMSMLNIACINEAITLGKCTEPKDILNETRSRVIGHLANDGSTDGGKDGMDCSLLIFSGNMVKYAGANNPVWVVRQGELLELEPDRMPVGKHDKDKTPFNQLAFPVLPGDMIYTITDGYPDQFGGPKGKKYMYKRLKELLVGLAGEIPRSQKAKLENEFASWRGEAEQVDDVTVIGIRVT